ncbi:MULTISPECIES: glycosyltransferase family A protein [unclassified Cupriavidus]|uniref:glycosyltransferase family 2 protein n=1 Tax=unclassified Cupriavidus TaxID=2640874 RepID=UPI0009DBE6EE|nr:MULTISPECIES: glycosyltransferase family A protein [unclassified Cupriavidus]
MSEQIPSITVLLPVRNGERTIIPAVRSILAQTFGDFELIVLDDGSTDSTAQLVLGLHDARIRLVSDGFQLGLTARLNQGVDLTRGRYLARMDADDLSFPERLKRQYQFLEEHPEVDLVGCRAAVFRNDGSIVGFLPFRETHEAICARPWRGIPLPHPTWMGRADWFRKHRYRVPEVRRAEDQELLLRSCTASRFACLDETLLAYRQGNYSVTSTLVARRHLLRAQLRMFIDRQQWTNAVLAALSSAVKAAVDVLAALPGMDKGLAFRRVEDPVPASVVERIQKLLASASRS